VLFKGQRQVDTTRILAINTLDEQEHTRFIHSATYEEFIDHLRLSPQHIAEAIEERLKG